MGFPGLDRAGYRQISHMVASKVITSTMSSTTSPWSDGIAMLKVISSKCVFGQIVDATMVGDTLFTSGTSFNTNVEIYGNNITKVKISTKTTGHKVIAYRRVLL
jgi:hypothetical protein